MRGLLIFLGLALAHAVPALGQVMCPPDGHLCDDGNPCTEDQCAGAGCSSFPIDGLPCDDGRFCTLGDFCLGGHCFGPTIRSCDDENPCTFDGCIGDHCTNAPNTCNDLDACTADSCAPTSGECQHDRRDCSDTDPCTEDLCDAATGGCSHPPLVCDDGDSCTVDSCDPTAGCVSVPNGSCTDNPKTFGFWKRQCHLDGPPHPSGDRLTQVDVSCVRAACTFATVATLEDLCARLEPDPPSDECERSEMQLMALMLNVCHGRISRSDPVSSLCGPSATVGDSAESADALLCAPDRSRDECREAECIAAGINTGRAIGTNSLVLTRQGSGQIRLDWGVPLAVAEGAASPRYRVWRRSPGESVFVQVAETSSLHHTDNTDGESEREYEVTPVR